VLCQPLHCRHVRRPIDVMADVLAVVNRIRRLRVAVLHQLVALGRQEAKLGYATIAIQHAQLQLLVTHQRNTVERYWQ
jgi:hypothetical protein